MNRDSRVGLLGIAVIAAICFAVNIVRGQDLLMSAIGVIVVLLVSMALRLF